MFCIPYKNASIIVDKSARSRTYGGANQVRSALQHYRWQVIGNRNDSAADVIIVTCLVPDQKMS